MNLIITPSMPRSRTADGDKSLLDWCH